MCKSVFRRILLFVAIMTSLMAVCLTISFADSQDEASKSEPVQVTQSDSKQNDSVSTEINQNRDMDTIVLHQQDAHQQLWQWRSKE